MVNFCVSLLSTTGVIGIGGGTGNITTGGTYLISGIVLGTKIGIGGNSSITTTGGTTTSIITGVLSIGISFIGGNPLSGAVVSCVSEFSLSPLLEKSLELEWSSLITLAFLVEIISVCDACNIPCALYIALP